MGAFARQLLDREGCGEGSKGPAARRLPRGGQASGSFRRIRGHVAETAKNCQEPALRTKVTSLDFKIVL